MMVLLILFGVSPIDLATQGNYRAAIAAYQEELKSASREDSFSILVDIGDLYLYWLYQPDSAMVYYQQVREKFPESKELGSVLYRMGHASELLEDFQNAARYYSDVVTKYRDCPYVDQALSAVERAFRKNYQEHLARVDGWPITRIEIDEMIQNMPTVMRIGYDKPEKLKELVDRKVIERLIRTYALKHRYDTIPEVRKRYYYSNKRYLMDDFLTREVFSRITVTDSEIKKYYDENRDKYLIKARVKAKEIVVNSDSLAKRLRDSVLIDSAAWDTLCKVYSVAPSRFSGGQLGYVVKGTRPDPIDSILFATEVGSVSTIISPDSGKFAFYKILEKKPARYRKLDEVKRMIKSTIEGEKKKAMTEALEDSLLKTVKVEYYLEGEHGDTLAIFDHHAITGDDVEFKKDQLPPFARDEFKGPEGLKKLLKEMVKEELRFIAAFKRKLYLYDTTFTKFQENRKQVMLNELWRREIVAKAKLTEDEIKAYYQEHRDDQYTVPAQIRLRALITKDSSFADSLYLSLRYRPWFWPFSHRYRTREFDSIVNHYSLNPDTVRVIRGADLGFVIKGTKKEIDSLVFPLGKGTISPPIYSVEDSSYYLYLVLDKNPVRVISYKQAKPEIERNLRRKKLNDRRTEFLDQLKAKAKIEYFLPVEKEEEKKEE